MSRIATLLLLAAAAVAQDAPAPKAERAPAREPGFLGVTAHALDAETRALFEIPEGVAKGVVIAEVVEGSAAEKAGLRPGDVITTFDGKPVTAFEELRDIVMARAAGESVAYVARRGTGTIEGKVVLGSRPVAMPGVEIAPMPPAADEADVKERVERVQKEIERLRERVEAERGRALHHPRSLGGWMHQEERALKEAREAGDERKAAWHGARLSVLREMHQAETQLPARRLDRIEEKLDLLIELLRERR